MICTHCQTPLPDGSNFCNTCGADVSDAGSAPRAARTGSADLQERLQAALAGRYQIERLLGRGGMGAVFLAKDIALDREVAIKVLPPEMAADESFVRRFEQEARTAAKLDHPNIMPIYSVEGIGDLHFFVMKYVPGRSLDQVLEAGALPVDVAQQILWEAACALGHAHQRGFVHRDIKPANILLDHDGHAMLTDFGISKALRSASQFTATGQVIGTPHYLSPEQAKGEQLDGRSDQYSLGVVAYRALAGHLPFDDDSVHTLLYKHIYETPPPVEEARSDLPPFLTTAVRRALNKNPQDRFATMEDFATALWPERPVSASRSGPRTSGGPSVASTAPTEITPAARPTRPARRRWPAAVVGVLLLAGGGAAAVIVLGRIGLKGGALPPAAPPQPSTQAAAESLAARPAAVTSPAAADTATSLSPATPSHAVSTSRNRSGAGRGTAPAEHRVQQRPAPRPVQPAPAQPVQQAAPTVGFLTVDATPFGTVYIDHVEIGDTPVAGQRLSPGRHIVEVRREGYRTAVDTVTISAGNTSVVRKVLIRGPS
jgi:predicted Ser/Thr protein kinase